MKLYHLQFGKERIKDRFGLTKEQVIKCISNNTNFSDLVHDENNTSVFVDFIPVEQHEDFDWEDISNMFNGFVKHHFSIRKIKGIRTNDYYSIMEAY